MEHKKKVFNRRQAQLNEITTDVISDFFYGGRGWWWIKTIFSFSVNVAFS